MIAISLPAIVGLAVAALVIIVLLAALRSMVNIVQQGTVGVVKRLGEYRRTHEPGLVLIVPFAYLLSVGALDWGPARQVASRIVRPILRTTSVPSGIPAADEVDEEAA